MRLVSIFGCARQCTAGVPPSASVAYGGPTEIFFPCFLNCDPEFWGADPRSERGTNPKPSRQNHGGYESYIIPYDTVQLQRCETTCVPRRRVPGCQLCHASNSTRPPRESSMHQTLTRAAPASPSP